VSEVVTAAPGKAVKGGTVSFCSETVWYVKKGQVMRRNHIIVALIAVAFVAAATFGLTELAEAGYPFTGSFGD